MKDFVAEIAKKPEAFRSRPSNLSQQQIIDRFIGKKEHRIGPARKKGSSEDLSVESTKVGDFLLTESLAKIFLTQGMSEKAIEIYKKLIWKFPQKKAYFASQIEKLKKG